MTDAERSPNLSGLTHDCSLGYSIFEFRELVEKRWRCGAEEGARERYRYNRRRQRCENQGQHKNDIFIHLL